jgi:hypothetical protein
MIVFHACESDSMGMQEVLVHYSMEAFEFGTERAHIYLPLGNHQIGIIVFMRHLQWRSSRVA